MEKQYWIVRTIGYGSDSEEVIQTIQEAGAKTIKLDLPKEFDRFKFFSINNGRGYFSIYEGSSGIAVLNDQKGLAEAKSFAEYQIKRYAKTPLGLDGSIESAQRSLINRFKNRDKKVPSLYLKGYEEKFGKANPKITKIKDLKVKSKNHVDLIKEAFNVGAKQIKVTFFAPYDPKKHGNYSDSLQKSLKKEKVSIYEVPKELYEVSRLLNSKDVKKIEWVIDIKKGVVLKAKKRQTGESVEKNDKKRTALGAGKRKSASGKIYYEYRKNRSDIKKKI